MVKTMGRTAFLPFLTTKSEIHSKEQRNAQCLTGYRKKVFRWKKKKSNKNPIELHIKMTMSSSFMLCRIQKTIGQKRTVDIKKSISDSSVEMPWKANLSESVDNFNVLWSRNRNIHEKQTNRIVWCFWVVLNFRSCWRVRRTPFLFWLISKVKLTPMISVLKAAQKIVEIFSKKQYMNMNSTATMA